MSYQRQRSLFSPGDTKPFKLSRSKIENFIQCQRCFYLDRRLGIAQPAGFPFNLNSAVDALLKKEFDLHRAKGEKHPLMKQYKINAIPFAHPDLDKWRENFFGVQYLHEPSGFFVTGAVDDLWVNPKGELHVVDYKATSKESEVTIDADWQMSYKRQMEVYQWLLRQNGFTVSDTGYFVYCNGRRDMKAFDGKLEFEIVIIPYTGDAEWIEDALLRAKKCLSSSRIPQPNPRCEYCSYREAAAAVE
ncbi:MAG: PD-(D/E)XK nuclease family protein [Patescibacteria group bacterium]